MPRIVLKDLQSEKTHTINDAEALLGRDPAASLVVDGENAKVVSGHHARIFFQDDSWWVEDMSRNGTVLDDERLRKGERHAIRPGQVLGLGETGPRYRVLSLEGRRVAETMVEAAPAAGPSATAPLKQGSVAPAQAAGSAPSPSSAAAPASEPGIGTTAMRRSEALRAGLQLPEEATEPMDPSPDWIVHVVVRETHSNHKWDVRGPLIKAGRSPECLIQIPAEQGASVSRVHTEMLIHDAGIHVRDAKSRNGTYVNGKRLTGPQEIRKGDLIMLGSGGPTLAVEDLHIIKADTKPTAAPFAKAHAPEPGAGTATPPKGGAASREKAPDAARKITPRSFAGVGRTAFFKDVLEDMSEKSARRVRLIVWASVGATILVAAILLWATQSRVAQSERRINEERARFEARADSIRLAASAEAVRLRAAFDSARQSSAPRQVLDSLRDALADASRRTGVLEVALTRARASLDQQLAAGDSARRRAEEEMTRLRAEMSRAQAGGGGSLDSLRRALQGAESRYADIQSQIRTIQNSNASLAEVAKLNQNAVGLVSTYSTTNAEGTGFAITPSGYFITNRHVVLDDDGTMVDSVFVTMADNRYGNWWRADVIEVGSGDVDIAVLKLRSYRGPYIKKVDWSSSKARQGEPAALIGFPRGFMMARDDADTVRTSMSAGVFSKITGSRIQFDGFSQGGSSGSPVFSANGEVVAVHFAGLKGAVGLGFAVPVSKVVPLLPLDARTELGIR